MITSSVHQSSLNLTPGLSFSPSDSKAIVDGNLKLILGLIWTLILHYSMSMPVWEGEDQEVTANNFLHRVTSVHKHTWKPRKV